MPLLILGLVGGAIVGGGATWIIDGTTGKLTSLAKWAAIGGAVYVGGKYLKAW